jgi:endonuclease/exonuclease/phosphatase family metal-dependent hydrolase
MVRRMHPDVLAVLELTPGFALELEAYGIDRMLPRHVLSIAPAAAGGGLYSALPIRALPNLVPCGFRMPRAEVTMANGARARVLAVHPYPPKRPIVDFWRTCLAGLPAGRESGPPWILAGDFNATLDHTEMQDVLDSGYRDAGEVTGGGLAPTWPADAVLPPPITIDHVLAPDEVTIAGYSVEDIPGSDHRAVFARLGVPRSVDDAAALGARTPGGAAARCPGASSGAALRAAVPSACRLAVDQLLEGHPGVVTAQRRG